MAESQTSSASESTDPEPLEKAKNWFGDISSDLFNIEVNTILSPEITAQKMPAPRHALLDIGKGYYEALEAMFVTSEAQEEADKPQEEEQSEADAASDEAQRIWRAIDDKGNYGSFAAFDAIRNQADKLLKDRVRRERLKADQRSVLPRIKENSDLLKGMFNSLCGRSKLFREPKVPMKESLQVQLNAAEEQAVKDSKQLSPNIIFEICTSISKDDTAKVTNDYSRPELINKEDQIPTLELLERDLVLMRKIWELSTDVIVMQTSIQVDGDVISRLNSKYLSHQDFSQLREYHDRGVDIALQHWSNLVDVAKELAQAIWKGITQ